MTAPQPDGRDPVATAHGLTDALNGMSAEVKRLSAYGRRNRHLIITVLVSLVLDVALTVAVALVAVQAHDAGTRAARASASNLALCEAGNTARAQQVQLWTFIINLPSGHKRSPQELQNVARFEKYLRTVFAPRDCPKLGQR